MLLFAKMTYAGSKEGLGSIFLGVPWWPVVIAQVIVLVALGAFFLLYWRHCLCWRDSVYDYLPGICL